VHVHPTQILISVLATWIVPSGRARLEVIVLSDRFWQQIRKWIGKWQLYLFFIDSFYSFLVIDAGPRLSRRRHIAMFWMLWHVWSSYIGRED
jgi:hypothetical protein